MDETRSTAEAACGAMIEGKPDGPDDDASASAAGASEPCPDQPLATRIEALLLAAERPVPSARLAAVLGLDPKGAGRRVEDALAELNEHYSATGRAFRARRLAGGWQLMTTPEFGALMIRMHTERQQSRLSQAALETLSIVAYRQPIMRAEIEAIRGVACGEVLRGLLDRRLVKIAGRAEELGRPMLYGTTNEFLKVFGLAGLDDLPPIEGVERRPIVETKSAPEAATPPEASGEEEPAE